MKRAGTKEFWKVLLTGADGVAAGHWGESALIKKKKERERERANLPFLHPFVPLRPTVDWMMPPMLVWMIFFTLSAD